MITVNKSEWPYKVTQGKWGSYNINDLPNHLKASGFIESKF